MATTCGRVVKTPSKLADSVSKKLVKGHRQSRNPKGRLIDALTKLDDKMVTNKTPTTSMIENTSQVTRSGLADDTAMTHVSDSGTNVEKEAETNGESYAYRYIFIHVCQKLYRYIGKLQQCYSLGEANKN